MTPANPAAGQNLKIVTQFSINYTCEPIGKSFTKSLGINTVSLDVCYAPKSPAPPTIFRDTFNIGFLNQGQAHVYFKVKLSASSSACFEDYVATHSEPLSVGAATYLEERNLSQLRVFPTIVDDHVDIVTERTQFKPNELFIFDLRGNYIIPKFHFLEENRLQIDTRSLIPGIYVLCIVGQGEMLWQRFAKQP
jgi:hypothetical protein